MQIGWHMRLPARPPSSYGRAMVLVLVLSMISGTSIQAAPTTSLPVSPPISTTGTTIAPGLTTSTTVTAPQPTITSTTTTTAPPETITSTTTAPKPTTTTTTAPPETITTANAVPPPATTNAAPTPTTPNAAPSPAATNAAALPATPNADFSLLWKCSPRGLDQCSFSAQSNVGLQNYNFILGSPVSNCLNGTTAIDSEISGSISTSEAWSPGLTIGIQLGKLNLQTSDSWTYTTTRTYSQSITIHVPPAQQGALIATVEYNVTSGHMEVNSTDVYPVFFNQPTGSIKYDAAVIGCGDTFNANYSAPLPISGSLQRPMSSSSLFMSAILVAITYVL